MNRSVPVGRLRPAGLSPGALAFPGAWMVGLAIARLTGSAAVVLMLVATLVAFVGTAVAGWWRLRRFEVVGVAAPGIATVGEPVLIIVDHHDRLRSRPPVWIDVAGVRRALDPTSPSAVAITCREAGVVRSLDVTTSSAGVPGFVWWRRRQSFDIEPIHAAPRAAGPLLAVDRVASPTLGESVPGRGAKTGDVDGSRPWRPGENEQAIHWPSTLRAGEVIAHDRDRQSETRWHVDLDGDPGRLRYTIEEGLRLGHRVTLTPEARADEVELSSVDDARRWSAIAAGDATASSTGGEPIPFWRRRLSLGSHLEARSTVGALPRLATATAAALSLWMLLGGLSAGPMLRVGVLCGVVTATAVSRRFPDGRRPPWVRLVTAGSAIAALGWIAIQNSGIGGLLEALRGPMPDLLILLVVVHGAEIADRRSNRVHLAVTGVVTAYAAGLRIDGAVGWWMLAWAVVATVAVRTTDRTGATVGVSPGAALRVTSWSLTGIVATLAVASLVPIPDGPASLGLPVRSVNDAVIDDPGALVGPDGSRSPTSNGAPTRGTIGRTAGYPGFSTTLDTAVRGDLGDDVVMRVRAPEPAFWRGQTFSEFDGRVWSVSEDTLDRKIDGPRIDVFPTIGDGAADGAPFEEFVQTFYVEADLPNLVFAATVADTVIFDGNITNRSDGALRADRTLTKGTVYSVVSRRVDVTADMLRSQGDIGERFAPFADRSEVVPFLSVPASTSDRTVELADQLRVAGSTYDTILAYQRWIGWNTRYDLDAPIPDGDAVDDFLFVSRLGFCEQIASSLAVMLRTQGIPARLATGYVPGERDRISGVFSVEARDAHAWVEVWFPETGWQPFDPTAEVPLAGEAARSTVGGDVTAALLDAVVARPVEVGLLVSAVFAALAASRAFVELRRRRARGPWGLLHDRFMALVPGAVTAPQAARMLTERFGDDAEVAHDVARILDRAAFDLDHRPTGVDHAMVSHALTTLHDLRRRTPVAGRRRASTEPAEVLTG